MIFVSSLSIMKLVLLCFLAKQTVQFPQWAALIHPSIACPSVQTTEVSNMHTHVQVLTLKINYWLRPPIRLLRGQDALRKYLQIRKPIYTVYRSILTPTTTAGSVYWLTSDALISVFTLLAGPSVRTALHQKHYGPGRPFSCTHRSFSVSRGLSVAAASTRRAL